MEHSISGLRYIIKIASKTKVGKISVLRSGNKLSYWKLKLIISGVNLKFEISSTITCIKLHLQQIWNPHPPGSLGYAGACLEMCKNEIKTHVS